MEEQKGVDEIMLPGFRFHPSDEELVGFYLRRKIQQKPLSVEIIKQLDIYKYDPWDLPNLAASGEKEWYFYCPRDRKYRNSARPNRVTGAGFWKATGTDRPIHSSQGSKCIGLKKSLVFYRGRASKGIKTDWMMHEFRLPSTSDSTKKYFDKNKIPANEAWAICKIFKKATTNAQRARSWISPAFDTNDNIANALINPQHAVDSVQLNPCNVTTAADKASSNTVFDQCSFYNTINTGLSPTHFPSAPCKQVHHMEYYKPCVVSHHSNVKDDVLNHPSYSVLSSNDQSFEHAPKCSIDDASSLFMDMSSSIIEDFIRGSDNLDYNMLQEQYFNGLAASFTGDGIQGNLGHEEETNNVSSEESHLLDETSIVFPFIPDDALKSDLLWDYSPCPSDYSTSYSTNNSSVMLDWIDS